MALCVRQLMENTGGGGGGRIVSGEVSNLTARSSYITASFATAASQNGFTICKLSFHKKIIQKEKILHIFITFIFYHGEFVKQDQHVPHFLSYFYKTVL